MRQRRCELCGYEPAMYRHYLCHDCFDDEEEYYANKEREKELYEEMEREMYEEMEKEYQAKTEQVASDADEPCEYCAEHGTMVCPDCITQDEQDSIR